MVALIRLIHGALSAFFVACIALVYYCGITDRSSPLLIPAVIALLFEGAIVVLNRGDCPLGSLHRRLGDDKAFFELLLPARAARLAVPALGLITTAGFLLLLI